MLAVSTTEVDGRAKEPLHWSLLTAERPLAGQTTVAHAKTILGWYRKRWSIETYLGALKTGTEIKERRLDHADDLRKCLAFDAITAARIFELQHLARIKPKTPACDIVSEDYIESLYAMLRGQGHRGIRAPPKSLDIQMFLINPARLAGFLSSKRQPMPRIRKPGKVTTN